MNLSDWFECKKYYEQKLLPEGTYRLVKLVDGYNHVRYRIDRSSVECGLSGSFTKWETVRGGYVSTLEEAESWVEKAILGRVKTEEVIKIYKE